MSDPSKSYYPRQISKTSPWDGKDGQLPQEEEIDLSDVELDKTEL